PALLHVGVDLGERRVRERARIRQHGPIEDREERDLVGRDIDAEGLARLDGGSSCEYAADAEEAGAARIVRRGIAGQHVGKGDLAGCLYGKLQIAARWYRRARWRLWPRLRACRATRERESSYGGKNESGRRGGCRRPPAAASQQALKQEHRDD